MRFTWVPCAIAATLVILGTHVSATAGIARFCPSDIASRIIYNEQVKLKLNQYLAAQVRLRAVEEKAAVIEQRASFARWFGLIGIRRARMRAQRDIDDLRYGIHVLVKKQPFFEEIRLARESLERARQAADPQELPRALESVGALVRQATRRPYERLDAKTNQDLQRLADEYLRELHHWVDDAGTQTTVSRALLAYQADSFRKAISADAYAESLGLSTPERLLITVFTGETQTMGYLSKVVGDRVFIERVRDAGFASIPIDQVLVVLPGAFQRTPPRWMTESLLERGWIETKDAPIRLVAIRLSDEGRELGVFETLGRPHELREYLIEDLTRLNPSVTVVAKHVGPLPDRARLHEKLVMLGTTLGRKLHAREKDAIAQVANRLIVEKDQKPTLVVIGIKYQALRPLFSPDALGEIEFWSRYRDGDFSHSVEELQLLQDPEVIKNIQRAYGPPTLGNEEKKP